MTPSSADAQPRPDDPRIIALAARLNLSRFSAFGRIFAVLAWARRGTTAPPTFAAIDGAAECAGFAQAMEAVGLLQVAEDGIAFRDIDGRLARKRAGNRRRVRRHRDRKKAAQRVPDVTAHYAATDEKDKKGQKRTPRAALPPFDPLRRPIRSRADAFHAPHLEPQAKLIVDHYADGVGLPNVHKQAAVILVMDLLDSGVDHAMLLRASHFYCVAVRRGGTPEPPERFFSVEGPWRDFAESRG